MFITLTVESVYFLMSLQLTECNTVWCFGYIKFTPKRMLSNTSVTVSVKVYV